MTDGPHLPAHVAAARIEQYLDRIAIEIDGADDAYLPCLLAWYQFLEKQLEIRRRAQSSVCSALERAKRAQIDRS